MYGSAADVKANILMRIEDVQMNKLESGLLHRYLEDPEQNR